MTRVSTKLRQPPDSERLFEQALAFASSAQVELAALMSRIQNLSEEKPMPYEQIRKAYSFPFPLRPYQVERLNAHCISNLAGLYWEPGCVDSETEYLTPTGWKRIADYSGGSSGTVQPRQRHGRVCGTLTMGKAPVRRDVAHHRPGRRPDAVR